MTLNRTIVRLALPTILMNISIPLLGAVDTGVVGHLPGAFALAGVGVGAAIFTVIYWGFGFFRMSTIGLTAQSYGRGDVGACVALLGRACLLALLVGIGVIALQGPILRVALWFVSPGGEVGAAAAAYFRIRIWAAPAAFLLWVFQGWFYGVQQVAPPVILTVLVNAANIVLDLLFVLRFGWGVEGVALATLLSQWSGVVLAAGWFFMSSGAYWRRFRLAEALHLGAVWQMMILNRDIFLRTLMLQAVTFYFVKASAVYGDVVLAANTVLIQLRMLAAYALDGFATAAEVVVGTAVGSADHLRLRQAVRLSMLWGLVAGCAIGGLYALLHPWWPGWFTNDPQTLATIALFMAWIFLEPALSNLPFSLDGVFVGAAAGRMMRNGMLAAALLIFFPAEWLFTRLWGNHGLWLAMQVFFLGRAATLALPLLRHLKAPDRYPLR